MIFINIRFQLYNEFKTKINPIIGSTMFEKYIYINIYINDELFVMFKVIKKENDDFKTNHENTSIIFLENNIFKTYKENIYWTENLNENPYILFVKTMNDFFHLRKNNFNKNENELWSFLLYYLNFYKEIHYNVNLIKSIQNLFQNKLLEKIEYIDFYQNDCRISFLSSSDLNKDTLTNTHIYILNYILEKIELFSLKKEYLNYLDLKDYYAIINQYKLNDNIDVLLLNNLDEKKHNKLLKKLLYNL